MASLVAVEGAEVLAPEAAEVGEEALRGAEDVGSKVEGEAKAASSKIEGLFGKTAVAEEGSAAEKVAKPSVLSRLGDVAVGYTIGQAVTSSNDKSESRDKTQGGNYLSDHYVSTGGQEQLATKIGYALLLVLVIIIIAYFAYKLGGGGTGGPNFSFWWSTSTCH